MQDAARGRGRGAPGVAARRGLRMGRGGADGVRSGRSRTRARSRGVRGRVCLKRTTAATYVVDACLTRPGNRRTGGGRLLVARGSVIEVRVLWRRMCSDSSHRTVCPTSARGFNTCRSAAWYHKAEQFFSPCEPRRRCSSCALRCSRDFSPHAPLVTRKHRWRVFF